MATLGIGLAYVVVVAHRTGSVMTGEGVFDRHREPYKFYFYVALFVVLSIGFLFGMAFYTTELFRMTQ